MKSPPRARSPTLLRILLRSGFGAENRFKEPSSFLPVNYFTNGGVAPIHPGHGAYETMKLLH